MSPLIIWFDQREIPMFYAKEVGVLASYVTLHFLALWWSRYSVNIRPAESPRPRSPPEGRGHAPPREPHSHPALGLALEEIDRLVADVRAVEGILRASAAAPG